MSRKPRILYVSTPWPHLSGFAIRALHVARALKHVGDVEVLIVDSEGLNRPSIPLLAEEFTFAGQLDVGPVTDHSFGRKLRASTSSRTPFPNGVAVDDRGHRRICTLAEEFDLIWFFKYRTANAFDRWVWPRAVLDIDDLPSAVYTSLLTTKRSLTDRLRTRWEISKWQRRERRLDERFTVLVTCSEDDKHALDAAVPIHVIPNGFSRPAVEPIRAPRTPPRVGFIGLFDYAANLDGVAWFVEHCWPLVKAQMPGVRLRLAGVGSTEAFHSCGDPQIEALGWIDNPAEEIGTWSLMIVPLHVGGGQRVKIAEGFSRKCPVVSTRLGAFGYDVESGRELLLADDPHDFAGACVSLLRDSSLAAAIAQRAFTSFLEKWTWDAIAPRVWAAAEDALQRSGRPAVAGPQ
jgi:glycosyltransferase involved in cell wall biosynthesis